MIKIHYIHIHIKFSKTENDFLKKLLRLKLKVLYKLYLLLLGKRGASKGVS